VPKAPKEFLSCDWTSNDEQVALPLPIRREINDQTQKLLLAPLAVWRSPPSSPLEN
jgi:hypothetical protein